MHANFKFLLWFMQKLTGDKIKGNQHVPRKFVPQECISNENKETEQC